MTLKDDGSDEEQFLGHQEPENKTKTEGDWDIFDAIPPDQDKELDENPIVYNFILRLLSLLAYCATFVSGFGTCVVKAMGLWITSRFRDENETNYDYSLDELNQPARRRKNKPWKKYKKRK